MRVFSDFDISVIYCVLMAMSAFVVYYSLRLAPRDDEDDNRDP